MNFFVFFIYFIMYVRDCLSAQFEYAKPPIPDIILSTL
jgi:hypothetical protein